MGGVGRSGRFNESERRSRVDGDVVDASSGLLWL